MTGFLKRDFCLLLPNLKFYAVLIALFAVVGILYSSSSSFASLYVMLFAFISLVNLFTYDDLNHWQGYAAAVPGGRKAMVNARYLLALCMALAVFLFQLCIDLMGPARYGFLADQTEALNNALLSGSAFLLYAGCILPCAYRFGGTKGRLVFVGIASLLGVGMAIAGTLVSIPELSGALSHLPAYLPVVLPCAAAVVLAISWPLSRWIMAVKEL